MSSEAKVVLSAKLVPMRPEDEAGPIDVREAVAAFREKHGLTEASIAKGCQYSNGAINQYLSGKYAADPAKIEDALVRFMRDYEARREISPELAPVKTACFKIAQGAMALARDTRGISIVTGPPGCGKTFAAKEFALRHKDVEIFMASAAWRTPWAVERMVLKRFTKPGRRLPGALVDIEDALIGELRARPRHLMINDAHNLSYFAVDGLAHISESCEIAVCLVGHEMLVDSITDIRRRDSELWERIRSRVCFFPVENKFTPREIKAVAEQILPDLGKEALEVLTDPVLVRSLRDCVKTCSTAKVLQTARKCDVTADLVREAVAYNEPPSFKDVSRIPGPKPKAQAPRL